MTEARPSDSLVVTYMSEPHYHRSHPDDDLRPACQPSRIRGTLAIRLEAERRGESPCLRCWPNE
jgi:hypothetical protein